MLSASQVMVGAAALFDRKWGRLWPSKVVCMLLPCPDKANNIIIDQIELMRQVGVADLQMCVFFLHTPKHWMSIVHYQGLLLALDGYSDEAHLNVLKPLAQEAKRRMIDLGFNVLRIDYPQFWKQNDCTSCGWYNLHFLKTILFERILDMGTDAKYSQPTDWNRFSEELTRLSGWTLRAHGRPREALH